MRTAVFPGLRLSDGRIDTRHMRHGARRGPAAARALRDALNVNLE
eukprot:SAG31_NODE_720_length_12587_cov_15.393114_5_plen_45_part_00